MSVIMSDMKTIAKSKPAKKPATKARRAAKPLPKVFTVRDMNRDTAGLLNAARQHGSVTIRSRSGEQFKVAPVVPEKPTASPRPDFLERMRLHHEQMRAAGYRPPSAADQERINRIIAGEE